jgi:hypothetical protein
MNLIQHQNNHSSTQDIRVIHLIQASSLLVLARLLAANGFLKLPSHFFSTLHSLQQQHQDHWTESSYINNTPGLLSHF